jgi:DNA repair exonuclease SbcCD ATPase subunit
MAISNSMCQEHIKTIWGKEAGFNIVAGTLTNIFAGAASVAGGMGDKSILSGLALFSNSERSLVNESVYKNALVSAVVNKIVEGRNNKSSFIADKILKSSYKEYPINLAVNDILDYHNSCSFMHGLLKAIKEGSTDSRVAKIRELEHTLNILKLQLEQKGNTDKSALQDRYDAINETLTTLQTNFDGVTLETNSREAKIEKLKSAIDTIILDLNAPDINDPRNVVRKQALEARYKKLMDALTNLETSFDGINFDSKKEKEGSTNSREAKMKALKDTLNKIELELNKIENDSNKSETTKALEELYKALMKDLTTLETSFDGVTLEAKAKIKELKNTINTIEFELQEIKNNNKNSNINTLRQQALDERCKALKKALTTLELLQ